MKVINQNNEKNICQCKQCNVMLEFDWYDVRSVQYEYVSGGIETKTDYAWIRCMLCNASIQIRYTSTKRKIMPKSELTGILEIDHERGVIYFHSDDERNKTGSVTVLRICSLPLIPENSFIDITHMRGVSFDGPQPQPDAPK